MTFRRKEPRDALSTCRHRATSAADAMRTVGPTLGGPGPPSGRQHRDKVWMSGRTREQNR
jgi:hypothetical protein